MAAIRAVLPALRHVRSQVGEYVNGSTQLEDFPALWPNSTSLKLPDRRVPPMLVSTGTSDLGKEPLRAKSFPPSRGKPNFPRPGLFFLDPGADPVGLWDAMGSSCHWGHGPLAMSARNRLTP